MKYIEANYRNCTLESVAEMFNMNPNYLSGMLKKNTGYSFKEMIQHYRFIYVTTMLKNTAQPVDQIILWAGYENTTYFYKSFGAVWFVPRSSIGRNTRVDCRNLLTERKTQC